MIASPPPSDASGMSSIVVREIANDVEMEAVYRLRDDVFVHEQDLTHDARDDPEDGHSIHLLAFDGGTPVGTGRVTLYGREAQVAWVAVAISHRRRGVGDAIMRALIERSRHEGATFMSLNAQAHAIPFYTRLGFESISGEFRMGGIAHRVMTRRLV